MAGAFLYHEQPGCAQVWGIWVAPEARGSGAARSLMQAVIDWARSRGVATLRLGLSTSPSSAPAEALYTSLGFEFTGEQEQMESDPSLGARIMTLRVV